MPVQPVQALFAGALDIVGDVHGEMAALDALLQRLGYDAHGEHPLGRRLIFVGDLCDRGPDSPGVLFFVRNLMARGLAQCVLGNHEMNLLRNERKSGNGWYFEDHPDHRRAEFAGVRRATARERDAARIFAAALPLALQRTDLRVTHAVWDDRSLDALSGAACRSTLDSYLHFEQQTLQRISPDLRSAADAEKQRFRDALYDRNASVPFLEALAREDELYQMGNPVRVITSGVERSTNGHSYFAGGKWRMVERVPWWQSYVANVPVIVGHFWRWYSPEGQARYTRDEADLFGGAAPEQWLDTGGRVYCTDFSVGARFLELRDRIAPGTYTRLAAVRWPEREVVFENGERRELTAR
jgi:hypothetical protein